MIRLLIPIIILWLLGMITWKMYVRSTDGASLSRQERKKAQQAEQEAEELKAALELVAETSADIDTQLMAQHALEQLKQENK